MPLFVATTMALGCRHKAGAGNLWCVSRQSGNVNDKSSEASTSVTEAVSLVSTHTNPLNATTQDANPSLEDTPGPVTDVPAVSDNPRTPSAGVSPATQAIVGTIPPPCKDHSVFINTGTNPPRSENAAISAKSCAAKKIIDAVFKQTTFPGQCVALRTALSNP